MELEIYNDNSYDKTISNANKIYLYDKEIEIISDDDWDVQPLPEIMRVHLQHGSNCSFERRNYNDNKLNEIMTVHALSEPVQVRNSINLGPNEPATTLTEKQIRNRNANRRHRANRYRHEVIHHVYSLFNITKVRQVLKAMNIFYINFRMVNTTLFIGLKNQTVVDEVNKMLSEKIFTKQHYERLYK